MRYRFQILYNYWQHNCCPSYQISSKSEGVNFFCAFHTISAMSYMKNFKKRLRKLYLFILYIISIIPKKFFIWKSVLFTPFYTWTIPRKENPLKKVFPLFSSLKLISKIDFSRLYTVDGISMIKSCVKFLPIN